MNPIITNNVTTRTLDEWMCFRIADMKPLLKEHKLKVSGKKKILAKRLYTYFTSNKKNKKKKKLILNHNFQRTNISKYNLDNLKFSLKYYKINSSGTKKECFERLYNYFITLNKYKPYTSNISKIQLLYRNHINKKILNLKGPAYGNLKMSNNQNDFLSFENISEIPDVYFFSFQDCDNFIYSFDIRSLNELIMNKKTTNPYNRIEFSKRTLNKLYQLLHLLRINKICLKLEEDEINDPVFEMSQKALEVFQKFDMLNNYTDVRWFLNLRKKSLKKLYKNAEDIWNYRAQLTPNMKKKIIPDGKAFKTPIWYVEKLNNKLEIQNIILNEFDSFVSLGETKDDKILGAMWMLTSLVSVSPDAANAMPQYIQLN